MTAFFYFSLSWFTNLLHALVLISLYLHISYAEEMCPISKYIECDMKSLQNCVPDIIPIEANGSTDRGSKVKLSLTAAVRVNLYTSKGELKPLAIVNWSVNSESQDLLNDMKDIQGFIIIVSPLSLVAFRPQSPQCVQFVIHPSHNETSSLQHSIGEFSFHLLELYINTKYSVTVMMVTRHSQVKQTLILTTPKMVTKLAASEWITGDIQMAKHPTEDILNVKFLLPIEHYGFEQFYIELKSSSGTLLEKKLIEYPQDVEYANVTFEYNKCYVFYIVMIQPVAKTSQGNCVCLDQKSQCRYHCRVSKSRIFHIKSEVLSCEGMYDNDYDDDVDDDGDGNDKDRDDARNSTYMPIFEMSRQSFNDSALDAWKIILYLISSLIVICLLVGLFRWRAKINEIEMTAVTSFPFPKILDDKMSATDYNHLLSWKSKYKENS